MSFLPNFSLRAVVLALAVVFCFVLVSPIQAAAINPPAPGSPSPDLLPAGCAGCTLLATIPSQVQLSSNGNWQATLNTSVFLDPSSFTSGSFTRSGPGLDFFYQVSNAASCAGCPTPPDSIGRFTAINFSPALSPGILVDIGINGGSVPGFSAAGTASPGTVDRVGSGDTIGWNFSAPGLLQVPLTAGTTSIILEVMTNITTYSVGHASALDGGTANFLAYQPQIVPEPASTLLIGAGMLALASLRRFRRR